MYIIGLQHIWFGCWCCVRKKSAQHFLIHPSHPAHKLETPQGATTDPPEVDVIEIRRKFAPDHCQRHQEVLKRNLATPVAFLHFLMWFVRWGRHWGAACLFQVAPYCWVVAGGRLAGRGFVSPHDPALPVCLMRWGWWGNMWGCGDDGAWSLVRPFLPVADMFAQIPVFGWSCVCEPIPRILVAVGRSHHATTNPGKPASRARQICTCVGCAVLSPEWSGLDLPCLLGMGRGVEVGGGGCVLSWPLVPVVGVSCTGCAALSPELSRTKNNLHALIYNVDVIPRASCVT